MSAHLSEDPNAGRTLLDEGSPDWWYAREVTKLLALGLLGIGIVNEIRNGTVREQCQKLFSGSAAVVETLPEGALEASTEQVANN